MGAVWAAVVVVDGTSSCWTVVPSLLLMDGVSSSSGRFMIKDRVSKAFSLFTSYTWASGQRSKKDCIQPDTHSFFSAHMTNMQAPKALNNVCKRWSSHIQTAFCSLKTWFLSSM